MGARPIETRVGAAPLISPRRPSREHYLIFTKTINLDTQYRDKMKLFRARERARA